MTSNHAVGVMSGMQCAQVPDFSHRFCNALIEQLPPVVSFGTTFATMPLVGRSNDFFRLIPAADNTEIRIDGTLVATRNRGVPYDFQGTSTSHRLIQTTQPSTLAQLSPGSGWDDVDVGDPTMFLVPPVERTYSPGPVLTTASPSA